MNFSGIFGAFRSTSKGSLVFKLVPGEFQGISEEVRGSHSRFIGFQGLFMVFQERFR